MSNETKSLAEAFPEEQERVRELLQEYVAIGRAGLFGATILRATLRRAEEAAASGDTIRMIQSFRELQKCTG